MNESGVGRSGPQPLTSPTPRWAGVRSRLSRTTLVDRLDRASQAALVVITAPSGHGKTTLLDLWQDVAQARGEAVLRVEGSEQTADAASLLGQLHTQLSARHGGFAPPGDRMIGDPDGLIDRLKARAHRSVIVIDHYERIASPDVDALIDRLSEACPGEVHMVVVGRSGPVLKTQVQAIRLQANDLRFTDNEITDYFAGTLAPDELAAVSAWTDGRPAHVELLQICAGLIPDALRQLDTMSPQGRLRRIEDVADAVIDCLPADAREGLIGAAFLERMSADLADAALGQSCSWRWLAALEQQGVVSVVEGSDSDCEFVCRATIRDALLRRLHRRGRRELNRAALRAASAFEAAGDVLSAMHYAKIAQASDQVARLIEAAGGIEYGLTWGALELRRLIDHMPSDLISLFPRLNIAHACALVKEGKVEVAREIARGVRAALMNGQNSGEATDELLARDLALIDLVVAAHSGEPIQSFDMERIAALDSVPLASRALTRGVINNLLCAAAQTCDDYMEAATRGEAALHFYRESRSANGVAHTLLHLSRICQELADPRGALERVDEARQEFLNRRTADHRGDAIAAVVRASVLFDLGEIEPASRLIEHALPLVEAGEHHQDVLYVGYALLVKLAVLKEGPAGATRHLNRGLAYARRHHISALTRLLQAHQLDLEPENGAFLAAFDGGVAADEPVRQTWRERDFADVLASKAAMIESRCDAALECLAAAASRAERATRQRAALDLKLRIVTVLDRSGRRSEALSTLQTTLTSAAQVGLMGPFLEHWPDIAELLTLSGSTAGPAAAANQIEFVRFLNEVLRIGNMTSPFKRSMFSEREQDILTRLVHGDNNKVIARALGISPETVRFHLKKIYAKFGMRIGHKTRDAVVTVARLQQFVA